MNTTSPLSINPAQAHFALGVLIETGKIRPSDVTVALNQLPHAMAEVQSRLALLNDANGKPQAVSIASDELKKTPRATMKKTKITPEQLASRQLQGRYLGLIRQIPASRRGQYQRIAKDRGREAAVTALRQTLGK